MTQLAEKPKLVPLNEEKSSTEKSHSKKEIDQFIKDNIKTPKGGRLTICNVFKNKYRVNVWVALSQKDRMIDENKIVDSYFIAIETNEEGLVFIDQT